jgi:CRP/FNR family transcriptional regulator, cyclic AMP receptor protein
MHRSLSPGRRPAAAYERFLMSGFTGADKAAPAAVLLADDRTSLGRQPNLFERLEERDRQLLLARAKRQVVYRGKPLMSQGDAHHGICLIESGVVRSFYTAPTGRVITLAYWHQGNFVGGPQIYGGGEHLWSAVAVKTSVVLALSGGDVRELMETSRGFSMGIVDCLIFKAKCYAVLAQMLGTRSASERLAQLLLNLCDLYGARKGSGIEIEAAFSHRDLANMIGATRQWVTASLKRLREQAVIDLAQGRLIVKRIDLLSSEMPAESGRMVV